MKTESSKNRGQLHTTMKPCGPLPTMKSGPGRKYSNPSAGFGKPQDCGPGDIPVTMSIDMPRAKPATMSTPMQATGRGKR